MMIGGCDIDARRRQDFAVHGKGGFRTAHIAEDCGQQALGAADMLNDQDRRGKIGWQTGDKGLESLNPALRGADHNKSGHSRRTRESSESPGKCLTQSMGWRVLAIAPDFVPEGTLMPRYFFDFRQGSEICTDSEGVEFPGVEQAYLEAYEAAVDMWSELLKQRRDPRRCAFEVHNKARQLMFTLPFQEVVDSCLDRERPPLRNTFEQVTASSHYAARAGSRLVDELVRLNQTLAQSRALLQRKV
jgi:hypothetical protein